VEGFQPPVELLLEGAVPGQETLVLRIVAAGGPAPEQQAVQHPLQDDSLVGAQQHPFLETGVVTLVLLADQQLQDTAARQRIAGRIAGRRVTRGVTGGLVVQELVDMRVLALAARSRALAVEEQQALFSGSASRSRAASQNSAAGITTLPPPRQSRTVPASLPVMKTRAAAPVPKCSLMR
jgi:hypothetical protein